MTVASRLLAAALLLVSSSSPFYQEEGTLIGAFKWTGFGVVLAGANGDQSEEDELVSDERQQEKSDGPAEEQAAQEEGKGASASLRGAVADRERKDPAAARKELAGVFEGLLQSLSPQAYSYLRKPPLVLVVPALFVELREGADRQRWEEERRLIHRRCERTGDIVPPRYELSADEVHAQEIDDGALWDEEIAPEDLRIRIQTIHGWLKEQYRLRLYYRKRLGTLKGNPQDLIASFSPGADLLPVSLEDIEGLSYAAELDDVPLSMDEETEDELSKSNKEEESIEAQQTEL
ncbi:hypothetical protein Emag_000244 [Eimeria magna]